MNLCFVVHNLNRRWDTAHGDDLLELTETDALNLCLEMFPSRAHLCLRRLGRSTACLKLISHVMGLFFGNSRGKSTSSRRCPLTNCYIIDLQ